MAIYVKEFNERFDAPAALVMGTLLEPWGGGASYDEFDVESY